MSSVGAIVGSYSKIRKVSSDQMISPVETFQPKLPVWLSFWASVKYACRRRISCVSISCSVMSIAVPTMLFKIPLSKTGTPTHRIYLTSPSGRTMRFLRSHLKTFRHHFFYRSRHELAILRMDQGEVFLK